MNYIYCLNYDWEISLKLKLTYPNIALQVDCLNSDCYVSREVRQQIEDTLLLPIAEIKQLQQYS
ncbi:NACHT C-terminal helical domain 2-containing protein [Nostoc linckia]|uniref:NACHT C-terminal helical domain 2-containing protein n=1 Tax=Nostoc linckia TaxID=92942 RepID=UPI0036F3DC3C